MKALKRNHRGVWFSENKSFCTNKWCLSIKKTWKVPLVDSCILLKYGVKPGTKIFG